MSERLTVPWYLKYPLSLVWLGWLAVMFGFAYEVIPAPQGLLWRGLIVLPIVVLAVVGERHAQRSGGLPLRKRMFR